MKVNWYKQTHVQRGRRLSSPEQVMKRLKEIRDKPKSAYHKHLKEGNIAVIYRSDRQSGRYDIVYHTPMEPEGGVAVCGECLDSFFSLDEDYLCPNCREETES